MTAPSITWGHGYLDDTWKTLSDDYTLTLSGSTGSMAVNSNRDLAITLSAYVAGAYVSNDDALGLSTAVYPKLIVRYKTSGNAQAAVTAVFSDASTQAILTATTAAAYTTSVLTLTTAKTLNTLRFYCATGTGTVSYDFALVCKGQFTFPQYTKLSWDKKNRYNNTAVPSRIGRRKAWLGAEETIVQINGDVDSTTSQWTRPQGSSSPTDSLPAQVLDDIHHNAATEPFQWFTSDRGSFKVVMENLEIIEDPTQDYLYAFACTLSEYTSTNAKNYTLTERFKL